MSGISDLPLSEQPQSPTASPRSLPAQALVPSLSRVLQRGT
jgi:hypothetical protein